MKSKKHLLMAAAVLLVAGFALYSKMVRSDRDVRPGVVVTLYDRGKLVCKVCASIADTPQKREIGLSGIRKLERFDGMLFPLESSLGTYFWMKGVMFPIDVYFFNKSGALVSQHSMTTCTRKECDLYPVPAEAVWALEVPSSVSSVVDARFSSAIITDEACAGYLAVEFLTTSSEK